MWIRESWESRQINPPGFAAFFSPSDLTVSNTRTQIETLAVAEETLRSGAVSMVAVQLNKPVGLTEGRRLQLAARGGRATGLAIIPEGMGSNATETRWHCRPVFDPMRPTEDSTLQKWELNKNKSGTLGAWHVRWDATSRRLALVSPPGQ
jgi:protein ImuA